MIFWTPPVQAGTARSRTGISSYNPVVGPANAVVPPSGKTISKTGEIISSCMAIVSPDDGTVPLVKRGILPPDEMIGPPMRRFRHVSESFRHMGK